MSSSQIDFTPTTSSFTIRNCFDETLFVSDSSRLDQDANSIHSIHSIHSPNPANVSSPGKRVGECRLNVSSPGKVVGECLANVSSPGKRVGECLANVSSPGQTCQNGHFGEYSHSPNWRIFGEYSNSTNSPASGHCLIIITIIFKLNV